MASTKSANSRRAGKSAAAFRTISEVAGDLDVPPHVLRFWETKFTQIKPLKRGGGRRYYRPEDIVLLRNIRELLYGEGYTIKGVQRLLRDGLVQLEEASPKVAAAGTTEAVPQQVSLLDDMDLPDGPQAAPEPAPLSSDATAGSMGSAAPASPTMENLQQILADLKAMRMRLQAAVENT